MQISKSLFDINSKKSTMLVVLLYVPEPDRCDMGSIRQSVTTRIYHRHHATGVNNSALSCVGSIDLTSRITTATADASLTTTCCCCWRDKDGHIVNVKHLNVNIDRDFKFYEKLYKIRGFFAIFKASTKTLKLFSQKVNTIQIILSAHRTIPVMSDIVGKNWSKTKMNTENLSKINSAQ